MPGPMRSSLPALRRAVRLLLTMVCALSLDPEPAAGQCHQSGVLTPAAALRRPENMLLMGANDGPSRRNSRAGDDVVGGLGRRGFPRLKLYGFHRSSSAGLDGSNGSSQAGALTTSSVPDASEASPYTAPEVRTALA